MGVSAAGASATGVRELPPAPPMPKEVCGRSAWEGVLRRSRSDSLAADAATFADHPADANACEQRLLAEWLPIISTQRTDLLFAVPDKSGKRRWGCAKVAARQYKEQQKKLEQKKLGDAIWSSFVIGFICDFT